MVRRASRPAVLRPRVASGAAGGATAHLYWRIYNTHVPSSSVLEISELRIYTDAVLADTAATKSSSAAPNFSTIDKLYDDSLATRCYWNAGVVVPGSFWFKWTFASAVVINGLAQGGFDTSSRYLDQFDLQWSDDDSAWTTQSVKTGLSYPGNFTLSSIYDVSS